MEKMELTLKQVLDQRNMTRYELSKRSGIQYQIIDNYYKNKVIRYDGNILARICVVLGCQPNDILKITSD